MNEMPTVRGHRLLRLLGEGGMGRVYLAEDETLGRQAAIKVVSGRIIADPDARARFLREARAMATVEHPHVVRVYSFGEHDGSTYIVMEYVAGEVLSARLKRQGRLGVEEALAITRQVAEALEAAWQKKIVHRDIKPSNILFDARGQVRVADFGLAKPIQVGSTEDDLTATGSIVGTPHYVSPEQARGRKLDFRCDVYSLGIVLYEMLAGRRPFDGGTAVEIVAQHLHENLPSLQELRPELPPAVVALVEWMTQKDPARRPGSYAELRGRLAGLSETSSGEITPTRTTAPVRRPAVRWRLAALGALLAGLVAAGVYTWRGLRPLPPPDTRLVVAVTPFYGPDEESSKEGRVMAALVENAISARLRRDDVKVLGVEETKRPVRSHEAARALGEQLGANAVVWGQAFALRGETEIQPYLTLVQQKVATESTPAVRRPTDAMEALDERAAGPMVLGAQASNQIELRKTGAKGVGDMVLMLVGTHALYTEHQPAKALAVIAQVPESAEGLRLSAVALAQLKRGSEARQALEKAASLAPGDTQGWAALGDARLVDGDLAGAAAAYSRAADAPTRQGALFEGALHERETYLARNGERRDSSYLLAVDLTSDRVTARYRLPGPLSSLRVREGRLELAWNEGSEAHPAEGAATLKGGRFSRPLSLGAGLRQRRDDVLSGSVLAANFDDDRKTDFAPRGTRADLPRTFPELDAVLRTARQRDPTQPWYLFYLGQAAWAQERRDEASAFWGEMLQGAYPAIPYYEYAWMAADYERFGQRQWADRAYATALQRRRAMSQPIEGGPLIERMIEIPLLSAGVRVSEAHDDDRAHTLLVRTRTLAGPTEGDALVSAAWVDHFRAQGDQAHAAAEQAFFVEAQASGYNFVRGPTLLDYTVTPLVGASLTFWILLGLEWRRARRDGGLGTLPPAARRVLVGMGALALAAFLPVLWMGQRVLATSTIPIGTSDALGSAGVIRELEARLTEQPSDALRFVLAVAQHLAGNSARAEELYASIPSDARARQDLQALRHGDAAPPVPMHSQDLAAAYDTHGPAAWLVAPWSFEWPALGSDGGGAWIVFHLWILDLALLLGLAARFLVRTAAGSGSSPLSWRRAVILLCGCTVAWAVGIACVSSESGRWHPGIWTASDTNLLNPFPRPPGAHQWAYFLAYPGARPYWSVVAGLAALGVALFVTGRPRDAASTAAPPPEAEAETLARP